MSESEIRLPARCLGRLDLMLEDLAREDKKEQRFRDGRVYAAAYAVVETFGLMLHLADPSDPQAVREAVVVAVDRYESAMRESNR